MYGGAFVLMYEAVRLYRIAQTVFRRTKLGEGTGRVVLSLLFKAILGIERIFHFETLDDPGFALLTGGKKVMSRSRLGQDVRRVSTRSAEAFMRETAPRLKKHRSTRSALTSMRSPDSPGNSAFPKDFTRFATRR